MRVPRTTAGRMRRSVRALAFALFAGTAAGCSPVYVVKAGIAEVGILRARQPIHRILADTTVSAETRAKLAWVMDARRFASEDLGFDVGEAYTQYTELESDTLVLVVSAAYRDRLAPKTWWFPIVGRVPYKGHFSVEGARSEAESLERDGYDTLVRPASAFSTLGWFNDPVVSPMLRADDVEIVTTTFHELAHREVFVPGDVVFNESLATFVGRIAAVRFFCTRDGGGPDTLKCARAEARWRDTLRFGAYIDDLVADLEDVLQALFYDTSLDASAKLARRNDFFAEALERFDSEVAPNLESLTFASFRDEPLNNATILARHRYYHRLPDFAALLALYDDDLPRALSDLKARARGTDEPYSLLPTASQP